MQHSATLKVSLRACIVSALVAVSSASPVISVSAAELYGMPTARVDQTRGVDQSVDYSRLTRLGHWDDRNYQLTAEDLKYLSPNEGEVSAQIPAFFRVELRKAWPHLQTTGSAQYPRAAWPMFKRKYGGIERNGKVWGPDFNANRVVPVNGELRISEIRNANEPTIEINKAQPQYAIAGSNNNGGQEMYYSQDGGETWAIQGVLPNTCCDPTVDWSSDGSIGYAAALSVSIGVSAWRTTDFGVTWENRIDITPEGSDKEWVHVDKSGASAFQDNVYITYHDGNTMQFARSEDMGLTYDVQSFGSAPRGMGSDITTTSNGDIYYVWGATSNSTIQLLKSTDGGDTFAAPQTITTTSGSFDFPIPAMEDRNAWIYPAVDADNSGGPNDGSVYVAFTDVTGIESGTPANNHTQIEVWYSRDGGATWDFSIPHATSDILEVDRFNQWMTVDESGNVHVVYYDTRNSLNRTGVDLYYAVSLDGGVTWDEPTRVSSETSLNVGTFQEWGDYNGVSVVGGKVIPIWADNRPTDGGTADNTDTFVADLTNVGAAPNFLLGSDSGTNFAVCVPDSINVDLDVGSLQGFAEPVTLSAPGLPAGFGVSFGTNPVAPGSMSSASIAVGGTVASGSYSIDIIGSAAGVDNRTLGVNITATDAVPGLAGLATPADGSIDQATMPTLTWTDATQAGSYEIQLASDAGFTNIVDQGVSDSTSYSVPVVLANDTTYYWRVRAVNTCGDGAFSPANSFDTGVTICVNPNLAIEDLATVSSSLPLADSSILESLAVSVTATHTWVGDLTLTLVHEDTGTEVELMNRPGVPASADGCGEDDLDVEFNDDSAVVVETECNTNPAIGGVVNPEGTLTDFAGESLGGTWRLDIRDDFDADPGTLTQWCLLPIVEDTTIDTDGDGVDDSVDNCSAVANPDQRDTNGDGFGNICDPDFDNNGVVNFLDVNAWTPTFNTACGDVDQDLNGDGACNFADYAIVTSFFLQPPGPGAVTD
ncbi:MAG: proprotein convertase P-domain-containing protein [Gammaproteobacteria bacterium]